uniref:Elongation of very long chain fatty acids protein n=1 Tax=Nilaparvata lugens TaxID=108931 RepID=A0A3Q8FP48_NILLU|nr:fatty acid elongase [Nilaparvata lugens]
MEVTVEQRIPFEAHYESQITSEDEIISSMPLMDSHWPVAIILVSYLVFVLELGPKFMKDRKPYDLKLVMYLYNLGQVLSNLYFLSMVFRKRNLIPFLFQQSCSPSPLPDLEMRTFIFHISWFWLMTKISDLMDTVIFVLRKKQRQITFLHTYHHFTMVLSVWIYIKYVRGEQGVMIGIVNSMVHVVMYSYYFLSALGPAIQPYLWWKSHITKLQLFQFAILTVFYATLLSRCEISHLQKMYNWYAVSQGILFTVLFSNFYMKSYKSAKEAKSKKISED